MTKIKIWIDRNAPRDTPTACAVGRPLNERYGNGDFVQWMACYGGLVWQVVDDVNVEWRIKGLGRFVPWLHDHRLVPRWRVTLVRRDREDLARIRGRLTLAA